MSNATSSTPGKESGNPHVASIGSIVGTYGVRPLVGQSRLPPHDCKDQPYSAARQAAHVGGSVLLGGVRFPLASTSFERVQRLVRRVLTAGTTVGTANGLM